MTRRPEVVEHLVEARLTPFGSVGGIVEAGGGVEDRLAGRSRVDLANSPRAMPSATMAITGREGLDMGADDVAGLGEDRMIGREQLRLDPRLLPLGR